MRSTSRRGVDDETGVKSGVGHGGGDRLGERDAAKELAAPDPGDQRMPKLLINGGFPSAPPSR